eukprot:TRINITY_DN1774_c0_g1_i1.p1 TRINITY_DN1774_c0_g1~~TRINITY_DN1774_c0_g1_i1.p1  ORF type:complete len:370 (-),score=40.45 TRINITY_DN1774_c0_g1_i1:254-1363(-)
MATATEKTISGFSEPNEHSLLLKDSQKIDIDSAFLLSVGVSLSTCTGFLAVWGYMNPGDVGKVCLCALICMVMRSVIFVASFLIGYYYVLPECLKVAPDDIHQLCMPGPIPVDAWIAKYGEKNIMVRDGLQRKIPHMFHVVFDVAVFTWAMQVLHLSPDGILAVSVLYRGMTVATQAVTLCNSSKMSDKCWYFVSATLFAAGRIRDGRHRWMNLSFVILSTFWGIFVAKIIWFKIIVTLFAPSQSSLLLQLMWMPVAIGDSFAEMVGSCWGKHWFNVTGVGEKNTKSIEGVVAMFVSTLVSSIWMISMAEREGVMQNASLHGWIVVSFMIAIATTLAETFSPRSTDNFTIPLSAGLVLYIAGLTFLASN